MTTYLQVHPLARVVLQLSVVAFAVGEVVAAVRSRRGGSRVSVWAELAFRVAFLAGILMLPLAAVAVPGEAIPGGVVPYLAGLVVGWLGLLLRWWSFAALGRLFSPVLTTSPGQSVVTRGPYRVLRHPSYTGLLAAVAGGGLMVGNWVGLVLALVLVLTALVYRIGIEERALVAELGDDYRDFARDRARLLPFVW